MLDPWLGKLEFKVAGNLIRSIITEEKRLEKSESFKEGKIRKRVACKQAVDFS
jgi:hypothetical protein